MLRRVLVAFCLVFAASPAFAGDVLVTVDLQMQTMHVRLDGQTLYRWDVSSGRAGYDTPPGRYQPTRMHRKYFSRTYDNAPMPFSIFFYEGYAIHGTTDLKNLGRVASHGCVRLDTTNAEILFDLVKQHGPDNTVIRVETDRTSAAILTEPAVPQTLVTEVASDAVQATELDDLTTGSTAVPVAWLRKGIDS